MKTVKKYNIIEYSVKGIKIIATFEDKKNALTFLESLGKKKDLPGQFYSMKISV